MKFKLFKKKEKREHEKEEGKESGEEKKLKEKLAAADTPKKDDKNKQGKVEHERRRLEAKYEEHKRKVKEKEIKSKLDKTLRKDFKKIKKSKKVSKAKRKKFSLRGFARVINLQDFLEKAGLEIKAKKLAKDVFRINIGICLVLSLVIIIFSIMNRGGFLNLLLFLLAFWVTVFFFLLAVIWAVYLFYLDMRIFHRTKAVETVFPDFLQLTSANISAGMPIDRALWYSVRPGFGVLAKEIENVAKNTMAGEDLSIALTTFAKKYNSKTIQRSINLLLEGLASGGEMAELLSKIAMNIEETKILKKEMAASVTTYVIFITFATILAAPVLFGLASQLLVVIKAITSKLGPNLMTSSSFFTFSFNSEAIKAADFKLFSYLMLTISAFSSACIVSVIRKGRIKEGITQIPVFIIISILVYTFASLIISGMFGAFF